MLSPELYGAAAPVVFSFGSMTSAEILTHEAGHNAASGSRHTAKGYGYNKTGLQSNKKGKVYPTLKNTLGIINDSGNRKFMKII